MFGREWVMEMVKVLYISVVNGECDGCCVGVPNSLDEGGGGRFVGM